MNHHMRPGTGSVGPGPTVSSGRILGSGLVRLAHWLAPAVLVCGIMVLPMSASAQASGAAESRSPDPSSAHFLQTVADRPSLSEVRLPLDRVSRIEPRRLHLRKRPVVLVAGDTIDPPPQGPPLEARGEVPDVSPGGAFIRSLALPGWGHAATGSHFRGGFYMAAQSGAIWMLSKSIAAHREARRFRNEEIRAVTDQLRASGIAQPDTLRLLAENDPRVEEWDELIEARSEQVEDWAAAGIFILLLSATDAFVSGHLMDRPEPLTIQAGPVARGRWEVSVGVRWGLHPWRR